MRSIDLPALRATGDIIAATIEEAEVAGNSVTIVTIREHAGSPARRRWYDRPADALAYAAEQADRHGLPLLDLRDPDIGG